MAKVWGRLSLDDCGEIRLGDGEAVDEGGRVFVARDVRLVADVRRSPGGGLLAGFRIEAGEAVYCGRDGLIYPRSLYVDGELAPAEWRETVAAAARMVLGSLVGLVYPELHWHRRGLLIEWNDFKRGFRYFVEAPEPDIALFRERVAVMARNTLRFEVEPPPEPVVAPAPVKPETWRDRPPML